MLGKFDGGEFDTVQFIHCGDMGEATYPGPRPPNSVASCNPEGSQFDTARPQYIWKTPPARFVVTEPRSRLEHGNPNVARRWILWRWYLPLLLG